MRNPSTGVLGLQETAQLIASLFHQERSIAPQEPDEEHNLPEGVTINPDISPQNLREAKESRKFKLITAIDGGSSTLLKSAGFQVGVARAASVTYENLKLTDSVTTPEWIIPSGEGIPIDTLKRLSDVIEIEIDPDPVWKGQTDKCRQILEFALMNDSLKQTPNPDFILIDGSLKPPDSVNPDLFNNCLRKAHRNGIVIMGVSKSSSLLWSENCPLISKFTQMLREKNKGGIWYLRISDLVKGYSPDAHLIDIYLVNLYNGLAPALRLDIPSIYRKEADQIISGLGAVSIDPEFPGYPYPLAAAHRKTRILPPRKTQLAQSIKDMVISLGIDKQILHSAFSDYHDILNADVPAEFLAIENDIF
ncbi:MAG: hypothetical protein GF315_13170 [candidate division Zixibacteria bacterium]|nr:hypothetical protein [candidate division Zixibacteria bacterium]